MPARLPINLASTPFQRETGSEKLAVILCSVLGVVLLGQLWIIWNERERAAEARAAIATLERQHAGLANNTNRFQDVMRQPVNVALLERTVFLNSLLERKGISWTRIFSDLERVMPSNVRLISIRPQVNGPGRVQLDMMVAAAGSEPVIALLMKLESQKIFDSTAIVSWLPPSQTEPMYRYRITVNYAQNL
jgi:type IV pilus assembly protein PilN